MAVWRASGRVTVEQNDAVQDTNQGHGDVIRVEGARTHNLKDVTLRLPLGCLTVVTGVSGSGKSTLVRDTLQRALSARLHQAQEPPGHFERLEGVELVDKVISVDQAAIGRTPRSNPATYVGAMDPIRKLFAPPFRVVAAQVEPV